MPNTSPSPEGSADSSTNAAPSHDNPAVAGTGTPARPGWQRALWVVIFTGAVICLAGLVMFTIRLFQEIVLG